MSSQHPVSDENHSGVSQSARSEGVQVGGVQVLCPYCGEISTNPRQCSHCRGLFEPLSRQATQNAMGPWFLHDPTHPFRPGCSFAMIRAMVSKGRITRETVIRGPATMQFWSLAGRTPGVANLFGVCHACNRRVEPNAQACPHCQAPFDHADDRQHLGLGPVRHVPGQPMPLSPTSPTLASPSARQVDQQPEVAFAPGRGIPVAPPTDQLVEPARPDPTPDRSIGPIIAIGIAMIAVGAVGGAIGAWLMFDAQSDRADQPLRSTDTKQAPSESTAHTTDTAPPAHPPENLPHETDSPEPGSVPDAHAPTAPEHTGKETPTTDSTDTTDTSARDTALLDQMRQLLRSARHAASAHQQTAALAELRSLLDTRPESIASDDRSVFTQAESWLTQHAWGLRLLEVPLR